MGCARATRADGTWNKTSRPILQRAQGLVGTGHHSFFTDKEGRLRIVFHAHNSTEEVAPRLMYIGSAEATSSTIKISDEPFISPQKVSSAVEAPTAQNHIPCYYDLTGRRTLPLKGGLYIADGRKVALH